MGKSGTAVFQHPRMGVTAGIKSPYCSYRLALVLRSSWIFELNNYVADCRRRSKMKYGPIKNRKIVTNPSQLIPTNQLLYLLWCKSSSSWIFELNNYVADCRRRSKMKKGPINNRTIVTYPSQLIPPNQLLYLLWCKSSSSSSSSTHTKPTDNIFDADENDTTARRRQESISSESGLWSDDVDMDSDAKEP